MPRARRGSGGDDDGALGGAGAAARGLGRRRCGSRSAPDGRIAAVAAGAAAEGQRVELLLPALANVHSHAFQRAMAGLSEARGPHPRDTFWTWRQIMYRFLDHLTPDDVEAIASLVQMEMLEAGYATNVEFHYLHHRPGGAPYDNVAEMAERIAAAAGRTGIGLTLLPVHYQFGGARPPAARARAAAVRHRPRRLRPPARRRRGGAPRPAGRRRHRRGAALAARGQPRGAGALCETLRPGRPLHMHLAEQIPEVEEVRGRHRPAAGRVAARPPRARPALDADPPDPHDRGRDPPARRDRRGRRPLPDHRVEPRRRHLQRHGLEGRRRAARLRVGQQHPHRARRGAAHPRIQPAPARHRPRHPRRAGALDRAGALRGGPRRRRDRRGPRDRGDPRRGSGPTSARSRAPTRCWPGATATRCSTA